MHSQGATLPKKRKVAVDRSFLGSLRITDAALAKILNHIREHPACLDHIPASSDKSLREAFGAGTSQAFENNAVTLQLPLLSGGTFAWKILSPQLLLPMWREEGPGMKILMSDCLRRSVGPLSYFLLGRTSARQRLAS